MMLYRLVLNTPGAAEFLQRTWKRDMRRRGNPHLELAVRHKNGSPSVIVADPDGSVTQRIEKLALKSGLDYQVKPYNVKV